MVGWSGEEIGPALDWTVSCRAEIRLEMGATPQSSANRVIEKPSGKIYPFSKMTVTFEPLM